jgi:RNA polymerase sigma factor (sigma-70 family)
LNNDIDIENPEFIDRLQAGDRTAFSRLVTRYHQRLLATARTMLTPADAEEAVQDGWIAAFKALPSFQRRSRLSTWLTRIVINEARMRLRRAGREIQLDITDDHRDALADRFRPGGHWQHPPANWGGDAPDALLTSEELQRCMEKTLEQLPDNQRLVLELRDMQGLDFEEICNTLDIGASNVRVLLHRARTRLFAVVDHFQETGEC